MRHTGTLFLSRPPAAGQRDAVRCFWQTHHAALLPGAALVVELERARIHTRACRPPRSEAHASVIHCARVLARSQEPAGASTRKAGDAAGVPRPTPHVYTGPVSQAAPCAR